MAIVALHFACVALNAAYVGPRTLEIMKQRERLEKEEGKGCHEEGVSSFALCILTALMREWRETDELPWSW